MLPQHYDPLLIVGTERTLPARVAVLLDDLGVYIVPTPQHLDATLTRWEDWDVRSMLMKLLGQQMSLRTFNLRLAILNEQRRKLCVPWGIASSYFADIPLPLLSHYLNPKVLWCQCAPAEAADLLLGAQLPGDQVSSSEALALCTRRHQTLSHWLHGYNTLTLEAQSIQAGNGEVVDQIIDFCGLTPTTDQLYRAMIGWPYEGDLDGQEKEYATVDEG